jgi:hypothetical protein
MTTCRVFPDSAPGMKSSKNRVRTAKNSGTQPGPTSSYSKAPLASFANRSIPAARTSTSACGSLMSGFGFLVATARAAATIDAVAPTLVARSQLSSSVSFIP